MELNGSVYVRYVMMKLILKRQEGEGAGQSMGGIFQPLSFLLIEYFLKKIDVHLISENQF